MGGACTLRLTLPHEGWFPNTFHVKMIWLNGLWQIVGAGVAPLSSLSHVMVADVCLSDAK